MFIKPQLKLMQILIIFCVFIEFVLSSCASEYDLNQTSKGYRTYKSDDISGLYDLNARMYDPSARQFLTRDSYNVKNKFGYCFGDPINNIDPSGHCRLAPIFKNKVGKIIAGVGATTFFTGTVLTCVGAVSKDTTMENAGIGCMFCGGLTLLFGGDVAQRNKAPVKPPSHEGYEVKFSCKDKNLTFESNIKTNTTGPIAFNETARKTAYGNLKNLASPENWLPGSVPERVCIPIFPGETQAAHEYNRYLGYIDDPLESLLNLSEEELQALQGYTSNKGVKWKSYYSLNDEEIFNKNIGSVSTWRPRDLSSF